MSNEIVAIQSQESLDTEGVGILQAEQNTDLFKTRSGRLYSS